MTPHPDPAGHDIDWLLSLVRDLQGQGISIEWNLLRIKENWEHEVRTGGDTPMRREAIYAKDDVEAWHRMKGYPIGDLVEERDDLLVELRLARAVVDAAEMRLYPRKRSGDGGDPSALQRLLALDAALAAYRAAYPANDRG